MLKEKNFFRRPVKHALWATVLIMIFVTIRLAIGERVGTNFEIAIRYIFAWPFVYACVYILLIVYLYFNPDADKPRNKD